MKTFPSSLAAPAAPALPSPCGRLAAACLLALVALLLPPRQAAALNDVNQLKLYGHWGTPKVPVSPAGYYFGGVVALSEKWTVVSSQYSFEGATYAGSVQVYSTATGAWMRKIVMPPPVVANTFFGTGMAISGDLVVIGAQGRDSNRGGAYVFNLATGAYVRTLVAAGAAAGESVGGSVAVSGKWVALSSYYGSKGAVYVFDLLTGAFQGRIDLGSAGVSGDSFGSSLSAEGDLLLIGAPGRDGKGAAYLYDLTTLAQAASLQPSSLAAGDRYGYAVVLNGGRVFVGAPYRASKKGSVFMGLKYQPFFYSEITAEDGAANDYFGYTLAADAGMLLVPSYGTNSSTGAVYLYDVGGVAYFTSSFSLVRKITAVDAQPGAIFGYPVAMCGNTALVGAESDSTQATVSGAAYLIRPLVAPFSAMNKVVAKGESAPGSPDTVFNVMSDPVVNDANYVAFTSTLSGTGSAGGTDAGMWTTLKTPNSLQLVTKSRAALTGGAVVQSLGLPILNESTHLHFPVTVKAGTGSATAASTKVILNQTLTGGPVTYSTNGGPAGSAFGTALISSFGEMVQSDESSQDKWAVILNLTHNAVNGTTAANDTGVQAESGNGLLIEGYREGVTQVPGSTLLFGQFSGRLSYLYKRYLFSAATTGPVLTNQVLVGKTLGTADGNVVAQKNDPAPQADGAPVISAFLGEATDGANGAVYRATLSGGTGTTTANNEGIFSVTTGNVKRQVIRKGQPVGGAGLKVGKILGIWAGYQGQQEVLVLVQLAGPGVTAANDQALLLVQNGSVGGFPNFNILMREGDPALGCANGATIGTISRVTMDGYSGSYMILATLAGAPAGTEQALYTGLVSAGNNSFQSAFKRPSLYLRKGWLFDGQPGKVRSISFNASNLTASGFGSTGRGSALSYAYTLAVTVEFDNGARQIMTGYTR
ncbi:MAG: quinoprotein [Verrucomicrobiaceae bacterium]|nr:quinoprotein [Verrucomicrobiaceae bacterium]